MMNNQLSLIPLGGVGDVTKNMYLYQYQDQILIVDCGLGFADETMLGVNLLLPDISYLLKTNKKIIGMLLTHGHEDHMGALPFILPQLKSSFPIFATPLTAAMANAKLKEFGISHGVQTVQFDNPKVEIGNFTASFIRVTHSVPDSAHIFIQTPVGNFYHGSDFKLDQTPWDGKKTDMNRIEELSKLGVRCLLSDCLGAEKRGSTASEFFLYDNFAKVLANCKGKLIVTTYSSHIARINQIIKAAAEFKRKICFIGRSIVKTKEIVQKLGYLKLDANVEVQVNELSRYADSDLVLLVAGSQGQENSAMSRIVNGEHSEIRMNPQDTVIFSSDTIPGNEVLVNSLIDAIAKKGVKVLYSELGTQFHVSGHGSGDDLAKLINLTKPKKILPIGGNFRHMAAYKSIAQNLNYKDNDIFLVDDGAEIIFTQEGARVGQSLKTKNVYVDEITGREVESFVVRDRQKISESGIVIVLVEIDATNGRIVDSPDVIVRGFTMNVKKIKEAIARDLTRKLNAKDKSSLVKNWVFMRRLVGEVSTEVIFRAFRRRPLVLPVVIEV